MSKRNGGKRRYHHPTRVVPAPEFFADLEREAAEAAARGEEFRAVFGGSFAAPVRWGR